MVDANYGSIQSKPTQASSRGKDESSMPVISIVLMLSTNFAYGCIISTLFLLILPLECKRIETESTRYHDFSISKSIALGIFAAIAGAAQLISPLVGMLSDCYIPNPNVKWLFKLGRRLPYLIIGTTLVVLGLIGQMWASAPIHVIDRYMADNGDMVNITGGSWLCYTLFFVVHMIGLNLIYCVVIALIPDLVPSHQTGVANGVFSLMEVTGSLFGFGAFHLLLGENVMRTYQMYAIISLCTAWAAYIVVSDREENVLKEQGNNNAGAETTSLASGYDVDEKHQSGWISPNDLVYALFYEPLLTKSISEIRNAYWIDIAKHYDFFLVTISRFFYYMGISSQTFFLYYIHDVLISSTQTSDGGNKAPTDNDPEADVAYLAVISQAFGAVTCIPVGILSDQYFHSRRKPFVYVSCLILAIGFMNITKCDSLTQMTGICMVLGAANGAYLTMDTSLAVDTLAVEEEHDTSPTREKVREEEEDQEAMKKSNAGAHEEGAAQMLGIWGVFGFLGSSLGPLIGATVLLTVGNIDSSSSSASTLSSDNDSNGGDSEENAMVSKYYSIHGYTVLFSISAFYFACSALSLTLVRKKGV